MWGEARSAWPRCRLPLPPATTWSCSRRRAATSGSARSAGPSPPAARSRCATTRSTSPRTSCTSSATTSACGTPTRRCATRGARLSRYDDHYSFMGASMYGGFAPPALESIVRAQLGIAQQCELPPVRLAAGQQELTATYDLFARSAATGTRGLRVRDPVNGERYWVEWRNHAGLDAQTAYGARSPARVEGKAAVLRHRHRHRAARRRRGHLRAVLSARRRAGVRPAGRPAVHLVRRRAHRAGRGRSALTPPGSGSPLPTPA